MPSKDQMTSAMNRSGALETRAARFGLPNEVGNDMRSDIERVRDKSEEFCNSSNEMQCAASTPRRTKASGDRRLCFYEFKCNRFDNWDSGLDPKRVSDSISTSVAV
jgi:hypothetical protein